MKQFYSVLSKTLWMACGALFFNQAQAQSSSTTAAGTCGSVVANFNSNSGSHASPSIHGQMFDSAFYYNPVRGYWTDMDGGRTTAPLSPRVLSIISPPYVNPSPQGQFNVGFYYIVPNAAIDKFQVRIVALEPGPGGSTVSNLIATSGPQWFKDWSSPAPYVDYDHTSSAGTSPANPLLTGDSGHVCIRILDADITNAPGIFYRVEVAYVLNTPVTDNFFAVYDNLSIGQNIAPAPLPVNFIGIVANKVDNGINVRWDVGDEVNVQKYELEKSTNGASFTAVGTIDARQKTVYSFTDPTPSKSSSVFYRIRSVDFDGSVKYSGIVRIKNNNSFSDAIRAYPSPVRSQLTVSHDQLNSRAKLSVSTMDGRILKVMTPSAGASNTMVDVSNLSSGMYLVRLDHGDGKIETTTFIKQ